jgi:hypothetical protein
VRDEQGKVWLRGRGHAILLHPYARVAFYAVRLTATEVVLDVGDDEPERYPHERLQKLELEPTPYRPDPGRRRPSAGPPSSSPV